MSNDKAAATHHPGPAPMSDERLAHLKRIVAALDGGLNGTAQRELLAEVDRLRRWKAEAMEVHAGWEAAWQAAGRPGMLGRPKSEGVRSEIERLRARLAEAERSAAELAPSDEVEVEGSIFERRELPQVLRNVMRHLADSRREAKALYLQRQETAAALARVTDDSMHMTLARRLHEESYGDAFEFDPEQDADPAGGMGALADAVLAVIRAVAADEQEAGQ